MRWLLLSLGLIIVVALCGTARALPKYNIPAQYRLSVATAEPTNCLVRVTGSVTNDFRVSETGEVTIDVPRLPRSCSWVCFGFTITDGSPKNLKAIQVLRDGRVLRRFSVRQIEGLPVDRAGARLIRL